MTGRQTRHHMYVALQDDDTISIFTMDPSTGALSRQEDVAVEGGAAPLALSPDKRVLHVGRRGSQEIASYGVDPRTGGLTFLGAAPLQGEPVYVSTDRTGRFVLSAYYYQSTAAVHAVNDDGVAAFPPVEWRHTAHGAHAILTDRSNRFAYVPHIANRGPNRIFQFGFDERTGRLTPNDPPFHEPEEYLGPRALAFHPSLDVVYFSDEQGSSVTAYAIDPEKGTLSPLQTISTLPAGYTGANTCSQIRVSASGEFLFAQPRPRQRRQLPGGRRDRPADRGGPGGDRAGSARVRARPGRALPVRGRTAVGPAGVLPGGPRERRADAPRDLRAGQQPDVGADDHAGRIGRYSVVCDTRAQVEGER